MPVLSIQALTDRSLHVAYEAVGFFLFDVQQDLVVLLAERVVVALLELGPFALLLFLAYIQRG